MALAPEYKDPDAVIIRGIDWTDHLQTGDTILTSQWFAEVGLAVVDLGVSGLVTRVRISGGEVGMTYRATNRITTSAGETLDLSLTLVIAEL